MNTKQITKIIQKIHEDHPSIFSTSFADITEEVFAIKNTHCYITVEPFKYDPLTDIIKYAFNIKLITNSKKDRTQFVDSYNEVVSIAVECIHFINRYFKLEESDITKYVQLDDDLTIGCQYDLIIEVKLDNDYCVNIWGEAYEDILTEDDLIKYVNNAE